MNNGTDTGSVMDGGAHHFHQTGDGDFIDSSVADSKERTKAITIVDEATVIINGGTVNFAVWVAEKATHILEDQQYYQ